MRQPITRTNELGPLAGSPIGEDARDQYNRDSLKSSLSQALTGRYHLLISALKIFAGYLLISSGGWNEGGRVITISCKH